MACLLLGVRTSLSNFHRIKMNDVDLDTKIFNFKAEVARLATVPMESLELVYCGNILDDDSTLRLSGIKPGVMVHVLKKKSKEVPLPAPTMSGTDIHSLVVAFRTLTLNPSYRCSLQKLSRPEVLENIIAISPGLKQDPVAISMIQDPELLVRMGDEGTVRRIVELHPALAEAAKYMAAAAHEDAVANGNSAMSGSYSGFSSLYEDLTDDDDMESSQSSDSIQQGVTRQPSFSMITQAQLAAAIASASQNAPPGASSSQDDSNAITPEMVSAAMQMAMAAVTPTSPAPTLSNTQGAEGQGSSSGNGFVDQMRQMRELGLTDDVVNLQALQLAGGNVHAAVDLVFSGAIPSD